LATIRQVRLLLEQRDGLLRKAARLIFGGDGSLYLVPYARSGKFFYGRRTMEAGQTADAFNFREQIEADSNPKLSIHQSGQVHIYAKDEPKAGPIFIPPLGDLRGEHVATVRWDTIGSVPEFTGKARAHGSEIDCAFGVPPDVESGALIFFANGTTSTFKTEIVQLAFQAEIATGTPIFFGLLAAAKPPLGDSDHGGVTVIAGFHPTNAPDEVDDYLYLRGT
jgi:hypothetical protein